MSSGECQNDIDRLYWPDNGTPPYVKLFNRYSCETGDGAWELKAPYDNNKQYSYMNGDFPDNVTSSIIVPPNYNAIIYRHGTLLDNENWSMIYGPRIIPSLKDYQPDRGSVTKVNNDQLSVIKIIAKKPWNEFKTDCCLERNGATPGECGKYWGSTNDGRCDALVRNYCADNPESIHCGCITSENEGVYYPQCLDKRCTNSRAYKPANIRRQIEDKPCELNYIDCSQVINTADSTNVQLEARFQQQCNIGDNTPSGGSSSTNPTNPTNPTNIPSGGSSGTGSDPSNGTDSSMIMYIILGVILLLIVGGITIAIIKRRKSQQGNHFPQNNFPQQSYPPYQQQW